jgi:predicted ABC-type ATPase
MVAGPNGSGKSTLTALLRNDYAVNFYTLLNADDIFAEVSKSLSLLSPVPIEQEKLVEYVKASEYDDDVKKCFIEKRVFTERDIIKFSSHDAVNSYTIALVTNFLQSSCVKENVSFSQETVFSHPSKVDALKVAYGSGYRTYLYFVASQDISINLTRISNRVKCGGHDVPMEKVIARAKRSLVNIKKALPYCSRAFFFDNSSMEMEFLAEYSQENDMSVKSDNLPDWFKSYVL